MDRFHVPRSEVQHSGMSKGKLGSFQKAERSLRSERMRVANK
jgi:hypothetical protein